MFHPRSVSQVRLMLPYRAVPSLLLVWALCLVSCSDRGSLIAPENTRTAALFQVTEGQPQTAAEAGTRSGQYRRIWPHEDGRGWAWLRITVDPLDRGNSDETARLTATLTAIP